MKTTVWIRSAIVREEIVAPRDFLTGYPVNYDPRDPDRRDFHTRARSVPFDTESEARTPLSGETRLLSVVEVPANEVLE